jgi:hypothetical protein
MSQPMPDFMESPFFDPEEFRMKDDAPDEQKKAFADWMQEGEAAAEAGVGL